ncbi:hypothetical protein GCM10008967_07010 [Bacillus carboniphilus]|uniref:Uncharacterized protein n=1 Tax=Bacillus carboniphilus TaxID=86663 RepID=A0ABN0VWK1_9BACI
MEKATQSMNHVLGIYGNFAEKIFGAEGLGVGQGDRFRVPHENRWRRHSFTGVDI